jgi:hypothetical protein
MLKKADSDEIRISLAYVKSGQLWCAIFYVAGKMKKERDNEK